MLIASKLLLARGYLGRAVDHPKHSVAKMILQIYCYAKSCWIDSSCSSNNLSNLFGRFIIGSLVWQMSLEEDCLADWCHVINHFATTHQRFPSG
jgi:hypothetical protein